MIVWNLTRTVKWNQTEGQGQSRTNTNVYIWLNRTNGLRLENHIRVPLAKQLWLQKEDKRLMLFFWLFMWVSNTSFGQKELNIIHIKIGLRVTGGWETLQRQPNPTKWKQIFLSTENLYGEKIRVYCQGRYIVKKKFTRNMLHWVLSSTNKRREIKCFCSHLEKDTKSKSPASLMSAFCPETKPL